MNSTARKVIASLLLGSVVLGIGACRTMRGLGEDTEKAGEKIQEEADEHIDNSSARTP